MTKKLSRKVADFQKIEILVITEIFSIYFKYPV